MGGILGMYVSFSFLVIFEIFEVIARSLIKAVNSWRNKKQATFQLGHQDQQESYLRNHTLFQRPLKTVSFS